MAQRKRLINDLRWARLADAPPPFAQKRPRYRGRRAQGIRYENRVHVHLGARFGDRYIPSLWFQFLDGAEPRMQWCQPDALFIDVRRGRITIVEVKYQHTVDAWYQLHKYLSVVRGVFGPGFRYALVEVVKWYDCAVAFPESVSLLADVVEAREGKFNVHIWNGR